MEESSSAQTCKYKYDNINMSNRDSLKFRRSYGSVKLNPREGEEGTLVDEFGVIVDKIQEVNEDVFLTRECNNFDLINLESSQNSLTSSSKCAYTPIDAITHYVGKDAKEVSFHDYLNKSSSDSVEQLNNVFGEEHKNCRLNDKEDFNKDKSSAESNSISSEGDSDSFSSVSNYKAGIVIQESSCLSLAVTDSPEDKSKSQYCEVLNSQDPSKEFNDFKSVSYTNQRDNQTAHEVVEYPTPSNDDKNEKCAIVEDVDSDDSYKWNKKINDTSYNAQYFYSTENHANSQIKTSHKEDIKADSCEDYDRSAVLITCQNLSTKPDLAPDSAMISRDDSYSDVFDNDSIDSHSTSRSTSSAFESAMSSNDMMSPFGTPRNSLSKHSSDSYGGSSKKKKSINFASLTSENIPNTLNRISMDRVDKSALKVPLHHVDIVAVEKAERGSNQNIVGYKKVHSSHSIRRLLNLTSQKKLIDKVSLKKDSLNDCQKEPQKICLTTKDKKINLKEFYASKRNKMVKPLEGERSNYRGKASSSVEVSGTSDPSVEKIRSTQKVGNRASKTNCRLDGAEKSRLLDESLSLIPSANSHSKDNKSRFISKIPRPVSKREVRQKSFLHGVHESSSNVEKSENVKDRNFNHLQRITTAKSDKSETLSRPSDGSECSYKATNSKYREEKTNCKNGSKIQMNTAQIVSIRSKYWMKEDKISFSSLGNSCIKKDEKRHEIKKEDRKKVKSTVYLTPQTMRQGSRLAYGKMVRVKTAPIKSTLQIREKSIVRESSRPDTAFTQIKTIRKPSKVVSIGALDVNKIH